MTSDPATVDDLRVRAWLEVREPMERQLGPLGRAVVAALGLAPGERVLDIGCGVGGTPHALAHEVGPGGRVLAIDVLQATVDIARRDPAPPANVDFVCGDAQSFPFEPGAFDVALSRFGLMFFADPAAAFENIRRALRPEGRLGFVCWRRLDENELDELPLRAASPHLPAALVREAATAGWFSLSAAETIRATLDRAGFRDIRITAHDEHVGSGDLASTVAVCSRVGALGKILRERPELRREATPALEAALSARDGPAGPLLRAATWVVVAHAP